MEKITMTFTPREIQMLDFSLHSRYMDYVDHSFKDESTSETDRRLAEEYKSLWERVKLAPPEDQILQDLSPDDIGIILYGLRLAFYQYRTQSFYAEDERVREYSADQKEKALDLRKRFQDIYGGELNG